MRWWRCVAREQTAHNEPMQTCLISLQGHARSSTEQQVMYLCSHWHWKNVSMEHINR